MVTSTRSSLWYWSKYPPSGWTPIPIYGSNSNYKQTAYYNSDGQQNKHINLTLPLQLLFESKVISRSASKVPRIRAGT